MMRKLFIFFITLLFIACSSIKKAQKHINIGEYDEAIELSISKLIKDKSNNSEHILLLKESFNKAVNKDLDKIDFLKEENNPENNQKIYELYVGLSKRQEYIKPLLPLKPKDSLNPVGFTFVNYNKQIVSAKNKLVDYLYTNSIQRIENSKFDKLELREVYDDLVYINELKPNYKNTRRLMKKVHINGTHYILVSVYNETEQIIPRKFQEELLQFNTYGLDDFWTVYHSQEDHKLDYDYTMELHFTNINISPERIKESQFTRQKKIKEKTETTDRKGNKKFIEKQKNIFCEVYQVKQFKSCEILARVNYYDNYLNKLIKSFPLQNQFIFEHYFANYHGDIRALDTKYRDMLNYSEVPFPSNKQMIYDTGKELKSRLKQIMINYHVND